MSNLVKQTPRLPAMAPEALDKVRAVEAMAREAEQLPLVTQHLIHAGMYARTIHLHEGTMITGVLIKIATTLIVTGEVRVYTGDEILHMTGHTVLACSAGRKTAFVALSDVSMTMLFPTTAKTVEEAERQFTDEYELLVSHQNHNDITITGE